MEFKVKALKLPYMVFKRSELNTDNKNENFMLHNEFTGNFFRSELISLKYKTYQIYH